MSVNGRQLADHYQAQADTLSRLVSEHRTMLGKLEQRDAELVAQLTEARRQLASVYLKALDDDNLARVASLTGFQGFVRRDPRVARDQERKVLQSGIAKIEADERYQKRDVLVGPDGTLTQELEQNEETLAPLQAECDRFESQEGFLELITIGYDTPRFAEKWWHASYWKHWAAGDRICKQLRLNDFGDDVIPAYTKYAEPRNVLRDEIARLTAQVNAVHELVQHHDQFVARLGQLDASYLAQAQDFLGEHLMNADAALLEQWATSEPELLRAVQMGVRTVAGLQAKRSILADMMRSGVPQTIAQLEERQQKARQKYGKFLRPKNEYRTFPATMVPAGFDDKARGVQAQLDKLDRKVDVLMTNRNYAAFDLRNDPYLWWWYFTESPPPRYAPSYFDYYQRNPSFQVVNDVTFQDAGADHSEDVARAFLSSDAETGGGILS